MATYGNHILVVILTWIPGSKIQSKSLFLQANGHQMNAARRDSLFSTDQPRLPQSNSTVTTAGRWNENGYFCYIALFILYMLRELPTKTDSCQSMALYFLTIFWYHLPFKLLMWKHKMHIQCCKFVNSSSCRNNWAMAGWVIPHASCGHLSSSAILAGCDGECWPSPSLYNNPGVCLKL